MSKLKSVSGSIHLPDLRIDFQLNFEEEEPDGSEAVKMVKILHQAMDMSPEAQDFLLKFAEFFGSKVSE